MMFQRGTFYTYTKNYNPGVIQMAKLKLKVSGDSMVASVSLLDDGVYLKVDDVLAFLQSNGISYGISMETIRELCANVKFNSEIPVAYGKGPKVGDDGKVNILVRREKVNYDTEKKVDSERHISPRPPRWINIISSRCMQHLFKLTPFLLNCSMFVFRFCQVR